MVRPIGEYIWYIVTVASNEHGVEPLKSAQRRKQSVMVPNSIAKYNEGMLGVTLSDWKTQKYRMEIKSKNGTTLSSHALDVALVNIHTIYNLTHGDNKPIDLMNFQSKVTLCLLKLETSSKPLARGKVFYWIKRVMMLAKKHKIERTLEGNKDNAEFAKRMQENSQSVYLLQNRGSFQAALFSFADLLKKAFNWLKALLSARVRKKKEPLKRTTFLQHVSQLKCSVCNAKFHMNCFNNL